MRSIARAQSHRAIRALVAPYTPPAPAKHARIANTHEQRTIGCVMILCTFVAISRDVYVSHDVVRVVNVVSIACRAREPTTSDAVAVCGRDIREWRGDSWAPKVTPLMYQRTPPPAPTASPRRRAHTAPRDGRRTQRREDAQKRGRARRIARARAATGRRARARTRELGGGRAQRG